MEVVEDLPIDMQRHVVGMPWDWVHTLRRVAKAVVAYLVAHPEPKH